jgi:hypothetical protein
MHPRTRKFALIFVLVLAVPTTVLAANWLLRWHSRLWQMVAPQQTAQELHKWYQLREFCNQSDIMEKRLDFAIQKLRDKRAYWNNRMVRWESSATNPKHVTMNFGLSKNPTLDDPDFKDADSQTNLLVGRRNYQIQDLRDRNSRYFEKIFNHAAKDRGEDPSIWGAAQAKHDELAQIIKSGEFQACMAELDNLLPTQVKAGGRQ